MPLKIARRGNVSPFIVMDVMRAANARAAAGSPVFHLEVGQPGTPAPRRVIEAAKQALDIDNIGYTEASGRPSLRRRIARHYRDRHGVEIDPARIMVTSGSSGGFLLSFLACFDAGDRVALAAPGYPAYRNILAALGVEPVILLTDAEHRFQPTLELIDREMEKGGGALDGLIIASPSNPTGTMLGRVEFTRLIEGCRARGIRVISDEIYHGITYGAPATSALELEQGDDAVVVNSFSKYFSMTGWRLGWLVLPEALIRPVECLGQNLFISAPTVSQYAGEAAFDCTAELDAYVAAYARSRDLLLRELPGAGFDKLAPADGAFYIYADVRHLSNDSEAFCRRMLAETGVASTPGIDFDPARGNGYVRFSFAAAEADIAEAVRCLQAWS
jgi:aspartate/methionine/tyrosine aminotransferase